MSGKSWFYLTLYHGPQDETTCINVDISEIIRVKLDAELSTPIISDIPISNIFTTQFYLSDDIVSDIEFVTPVTNNIEEVDQFVKLVNNVEGVRSDISTVTEVVWCVN